MSRTSKSARILPFGVALTVLLSLAAAHAAPVQMDDRPDFGPIESLDERFQHVAELTPEFAGIFRSPDGTIFLQLTDPTQEDRAVRAIENVFGRDFLGENGVQVVEAKYGFETLTRWHEQLRPILSIQGVTMTDIDEATNRLTIGIADAGSETSVREELSRLGVPDEAINVEVVPEMAPLATLQSRYRPTMGGMQIAFGCTSSSCRVCTDGFNAIRNGIPGFVTNSHCTNVQGGMESTVYAQPAPWVASSRVGYEIADPSYWTGGSCPAGRRCRYSDSAFVRFDGGVSYSRGRVARTTGLGSLTISSVYPDFRINSEAAYPLKGEVLNKMGRTTGWSQGTVSRTCFTTNVTGTNITLLCQDAVTAATSQGDSGSPVFKIVSSPNRIRLYGILWGGNGTEFAFSRFSQIQRELGTLATCDPALGGC